MIKTGDIILTQGAFITAAIFFGFLVLCFGFLVFIMIKTPVMTFFNAMFTGNPLFIMITNSKFFYFKVGRKPKFQTSYIKGTGPIFLTPESSLIEKTTKASTFLVYGETGATIPPEYPAVLQEIKQKGAIIKNYGDYESFFTNNIDLNLNIPYYKTFKGNDLKYMFPVDLNSSFLDAIIEYEKRAASKFSDNMIKWLFAGGFFLVAAAISLYVIINMVNPAAPEVIIQVMETVNGTLVI